VRAQVRRYGRLAHLPESLRGQRGVEGMDEFLGQLRASQLHHWERIERNPPFAAGVPMPRRLR